MPSRTDRIVVRSPIATLRQSTGTDPDIVVSAIVRTPHIAHVGEPRVP
jgi:hypothetical protein